MPGFRRLAVGLVLQKTRTRPSRGWIPCTHSLTNKKSLVINVINPYPPRLFHKQRGTGWNLPHGMDHKWFLQFRHIHPYTWLQYIEILRVQAAHGHVSSPSHLIFVGQSCRNRVTTTQIWEACVATRIAQVEQHCDIASLWANVKLLKNALDFHNNSFAWLHQLNLQLQRGACNVSQVWAIKDNKGIRLGKCH